MRNTDEKSTSEKIICFLEQIPNGKIFNYEDLVPCGNNRNVRSAVCLLRTNKVIVRIAQGLFMKYEDKDLNIDIITIAEELGRRNNETIKIEPGSYISYLDGSYQRKKILRFRTNGSSRTINYEGIALQFIKQMEKPKRKD